MKILKALKKVFSRENGLGMIEMFVVLALIIGTFVAMLQLAMFERRSQVLAGQRIKATLLTEQALEVTRSMRDKDWDAFTALSLDTPYHPVFSGNDWDLSLTNPGPTDIYTISVQLSEVFRDGAGDIAGSGTSDPETREATATVSWTAPGGDANSIDISTYFTNWRGHQ
ncbi:MAG: hypothetical protein WD712_02890 [Candidatus Spechtbacterales bacterium]